MAGRKFAGIELGGTTWALAIAQDSPLNIVARTRIQTTTPAETFALAFAWLDTQSFDAIGIASFGPVDLNPASATYGFITSTPKPHWGNTDVVGAFKKQYPGVPINFETDVNAPALFESAFGGHGDVSSLCYITVGTGIGVGVCVEGKAVHGLMHPEAGHMHIPIAEEDLAAGFKGICPFHGSCAEGMAAAGAIAARLSIERQALQSIPDSDPVWDTVAHYLAHVCVNLALTVSPQVIVIGGGVPKRNGLFDKIHAKFLKFMNGYVKTPPMTEFIRPSIHEDVGLVSSLELSRLALP
ncbi:fructokinase [Achlya hypogyna]|uniref:fructokinase n=1 Tax=Achlya hypogyna TaxID=1202772 RepID=A0A1V9YEI1_ACHHY|nr:fructokinase [Achlya hypogyna]